MVDTSLMSVGVYTHRSPAGGKGVSPHCGMGTGLVFYITLSVVFLKPLTRRLYFVQTIPKKNATCGGLVKRF